MASRAHVVGNPVDGWRRRAVVFVGRAAAAAARRELEGRGLLVYEPARREEGVGGGVGAEALSMRWPVSADGAEDHAAPPPLPPAGASHPWWPSHNHW